MDANQEHVPGVTLIEVLRHKRTFDEPALIGILLPLIESLERMHAAGKLHLSISPATIVLQGGATPLLVGAGGRSRQDPGYSAIERYADEDRNGPWTDIYSLGAVAYRLISGLPPPLAGERAAVDTMRSATEAGGTSYRKSLLDAIDWALKVDPKERPQQLADWKAVWIDAREAHRAKAEPPPTPAPVEKPKRVFTPRPPPPKPITPPPQPTQPKPIAPPRAMEPFPESRPTRPSLFSAVLAVIIIGSLAGYVWHLQRPKTIAPVQLPPAVTAAPTATPVPTAAAPAPVEERSQPEQTSDTTASKLRGDWTGRATYSSMLRGTDCAAAVTRTWKLSIVDASADGKSIAGMFWTSLRADGQSKCAKVRYANEVMGEFSARLSSAGALQMTTKVSDCRGSCKNTGGLMDYQSLNRTYRVALSGQMDRLSFSDNATGFVLKRD